MDTLPHGAVVFAVIGYVHKLWYDSIRWYDPGLFKT